MCRFWISAILAIAGPATAQVIVSPTRVDVATGGPRGSVVTIENHAREDKRYEISMSPWSHQSGAGDFLVAPPVLVVRPGQIAQIKLAPRKPLVGDIEQAYRLNVDDISLGASRLSFSVPVFASSAPVSPILSGQCANGTLKVANTGNGHVLLTAVEEDGKRRQVHAYVLPGESVEIPVKGSAVTAIDEVGHAVAARCG